MVDDTKAPVPPEAEASLSLRSDEQPSLSSTPSEPFEEAEDDEEDGSIPEHHFEIKTTEGKTGKMKGVIREKVSLMIGNSLFCKRKTVNGSVFFSCNTCETSYNTHLSAIAKIKEDGSYELIEWPRSRDHACWSDGNQALIRQARTEMFTKITETRELILPNPQRMTDLKLALPLFQYSQDESVVKGDQVLDDGRQVVMFTTNVHLKYLAKSEQVLADGTFRITPKP